MNGDLPKARTLGVDLSVGTFREHIAAMAAMAKAKRSGYVCCVNVHMCVTADRDPTFARVVNEADVATADGMPMLKALDRIHGLHQERVAGNDLMPALMAEAESQGIAVYFHGGEPAVLEAIVAKAAREFPKLRISGTYSPPFRAATEEDLIADAQRIQRSGASIVFVSLGCPRQERFMAKMKGKVDALMVGVGGAFLLYAGVDGRAPQWMRDASLEWLFRLSLEPKRLWKRYLFTNSAFLLLVGKEMIRKRG